MNPPERLAALGIGAAVPDPINQALFLVNAEGAGHVSRPVFVQPPAPR
ncbi:MAG TPA: hypothetical protein VEP46_03300 [Vicinamibacterales bacterium]|nr:hypothetical protein [Vicinamibacterales bacterium]